MIPSDKNSQTNWSSNQLPQENKPEKKPSIFKNITNAIFFPFTKKEDKGLKDLNIKINQPSELNQKKETGEDIKYRLLKEEIPETLEESLKSDLPLTEQFPENVKKDFNNTRIVQENGQKFTCSDQFAKDMERDICFLRKDGNLKDVTPIPQANTENKISQGILAIRELLDENNEKWELPLESVVNQHAFFAFYDTPRMMLSLLFMDEKNTWSEDNKDFCFTPIDRKEPIEMEVIRDKENNIEEVRFILATSIDIYKESKGDRFLKQDDIKIPVVLDAVKLFFNFTLALDDKNEPIIKDTKVMHLLK